MHKLSIVSIDDGERGCSRTDVQWVVYKLQYLLRLRYCCYIALITSYYQNITYVIRIANNNNNYDDKGYRWCAIRARSQCKYIIIMHRNNNKKFNIIIIIILLSV